MLSSIVDAATAAKSERSGIGELPAHGPRSGFGGNGEGCTEEEGGEGQRERRSERRCEWFFFFIFAGGDAVGALVYRCFNRLSLFSRYAALKRLARKTGESTTSSLLQCERGLRSLSRYVIAIHGPPQLRDEELHAVACSGVTLRGRNGLRDRWGRDAAEEWLRGERKPMPCVVKLPLPSEFGEFREFVEHEVRAGRGVMTGEHQVQSLTRVLRMLQGLLFCNNKKGERGGGGLGGLARRIGRSASAERCLDELRGLDTVGPFFAWQIFSDLVAVRDSGLVSSKEEDDRNVLTAAAVKDSRFDYALFGPGARKGALILDGGAAELLESDMISGGECSSQERALERSVRILREFPRALERTGLERGWREHARGRAFDLETCEHMLCEFYGDLPGIVRGALTSGGVAREVGHAARKAGCAWPPLGLENSTVEWRPNPCTNAEHEDLRRMIADCKPGIATADKVKEEK